ncbi:hypothetical protein [Paenibacillus sp. NFR01]|uniref:hypothetical protein n=1 Tax=Paenibacillus sp. NFR01 TaxID=1566279 RepID=UPI001113771F|nr:hypothetical protein [Paenibacillus sp. NFR01]
MDIKTDDFTIKNVHLVKFNNYIYLSDGYLEIIGSNKSFEGMSLNGDIDGDSFLNISMAGDPFKIENQKHILLDNGYLYKVKTHKNSSLGIYIKYQVNGEEKIVVQNYRLEDIIKPLVRTSVED